MKTLFDKIWETHVVMQNSEGLDLLYIDQHFIHEVTSPQAFSGLRLAQRHVRCPEKTFATMDHNVPTKVEERKHISDYIAKKQLDTLRNNCSEFGIEIADIESDMNGIVHIIGPELGKTLPNKTIVCGDSHTATHGAFGTIAFGIGTSEVEHVLATQTLWQKKPKTMGIRITGTLQNGVSAKDIILALLSKYGVSLGVGYAIEFYGETVERLSMAERMTLCNMAIEGGAKFGLCKPDETTFAYIKGRKYAPKDEVFEEACEFWRTLYTESEQAYDVVRSLDVMNLEPQVTWGTNPSQGGGISDCIPVSNDENVQKALDYMGFTYGLALKDIPVQHVFIGSCTNGRLEDLYDGALMIQGKKVDPSVIAVVVPGSYAIKRAAEESGLAQQYIDAGFEWREPGCSTCLGMNSDIIPEDEHCISTSNRNFEGRQGYRARTHLVSPKMAVAAAIHGRLVDVREEVRNGTV